MAGENPRKRILKSGKVSWEARYRDVAGKQRSKSFSRKKEAVGFLDDQRSDVRRGDWINPEDLAVTLRKLAAEAAELSPEEGTRSQHRYYASQLGDIGDHPIGKLRHADLQTWQNQLLEGRPWVEGKKPLESNTARNMGVWVNGLLKREVKEGRLKRNPAELMILPDPQDTVRLADIPTVDQVNNLIKVALAGVEKKNPSKKNHPYDAWPHATFARIVAFMAGTGMRPSEIAGLRWQDLSLEKMVIDVTVQASRDGNRVKKLKTDNGNRVIPISLDVATILRQQKELGQEGPDGTVFGTSRGARFNAGGIGDIYRKFQKEAGMDALRLYSLRHFYASRLIASGTSIKAVSVVLGHKNPAITLQVYTHLWPGDLDVVRTASSGFLRDWCGISVKNQVVNVIDLRGQAA